MKSNLARIALIAAGLVLSACSIVPRGAALQSEVLAAAEPGTETLPDFAVEPVTRIALPVFANWPAVGEPHLHWIERVRQPANRIIAPGDTLAVTIWSTEESGLLTSPGQRFVTLPEIRVSPSGTIFLPYIGTQRVEGMSPERAREVIEERYIDVSPSAQVQLMLAEGRASAVSLVSGVGAPGSYPMPDNDYTILALLADGGGAIANLNNPQVRLQRGSQIYGVSLDRLLDNPGLNTTLRGGDRVFVEDDERFFLSLGAAGSEAIHPFPKDRITALEALSLIGGVTDNRADPQGVLILRDYPSGAVRADRSGPPQERVVFTIDLTSADGLFSAGEFRVRSGDLVYATESPVTTAQSIFGLVGTAFGLASQVSN